MSTAEKRIRSLGDDAFFDPPWGGSFAEIRVDEGIISSGYNDQPEDDDDAVPCGEE